MRKSNPFPHETLDAKDIILRHMVCLHRFLNSLLTAISFILLAIPSAFSANSTHRTQEMLGFHSIIVVNQDASIDVTEVISIYNSHKRHGFIRRLPAKRTDNQGKNRALVYELKHVLLNQDEPFFRTSLTPDHFNIYIGNAETILKPGIYVYTLSYRIKQGINFLDETDVFNDNVLGTSWDIPILKAQADLQLPKGTQILSYFASTGDVKHGAGQDIAVQQLANNHLTFMTQRILEPGEHFTVEVQWPKGLVARPSFLKRLSAKLTPAQLFLFKVTVFFSGNLAMLEFL